MREHKLRALLGKDSNVTRSLIVAEASCVPMLLFLLYCELYTIVSTLRPGTDI